MKIGETLVHEGFLSADQLTSVLHEQKNTNDRIGDIILRKGLISPEDLAPVLARHFQIPFVQLKDFYKDISQEVIDAIPLELASRFTIIPVKLEEKTLTIAISDPLNLEAIDTLRIKTQYKIKCVVTSENDIMEAIEYCYYNMPRMREFIEDFIDTEVTADEVIKEDPDKLRMGASDRPVVQYVRSLIIQAFNSRASDIHLQPKQDKAELRFRIDGILYQIDPPPKAMLPAICTRIKILSGLDIAERRLPQDGRFKVKIGNSEIDIRTSTFPTIYGESVVLRLLNTSKPLLGLEQLGFDHQDLVKFRELVHHSYGMILVTGPTGSGKTTTLYTALNEIKAKEKNIITLEDPVEYRLPFIQQSQVNNQIGFNFARGLRSILRQDPDIIMVGEIRDQETAEIAIHAALSGHLVFSTLHTNDASGASVRMVKMGVEPYLITSSLIGVIAQRLVRTICSNCRETYTASEEITKKLPQNSGIHEFSRGVGCPDCLRSGYKGRTGIYELLVPNENIIRLIQENRTSDEIRFAAQKQGMKTLRQICMEKLREQITTPEEFLRVTQETEEFE